MGIEKYASASRGLASELAESLKKEDVIALAKEVGAEGLKSWVAWTSENESLVTSYLLATPSERMRRSEWKNDDVLRRKLVLAAISRCNEAAAMQDLLSQYWHLVEPGSSYRQAAAEASLLLNDAYVAAYDLRYWPADLLKMPSPFDLP